MSEYMWGGRVVPSDEVEALKAQGFQLTEVKGSQESTSDTSTSAPGSKPTTKTPPEGK